jgi:hypothetical protein
MTSKYSVADIDYDDWQSYVHINRDREKENRLYYEVLGLKDDSKYTLINEHCSTHQIDISPCGNSVYMSKIEGYSLFDWITVLERASRLITIDTGVCLLAEVFLPKDVPCHLINRYSPPSFVDLPNIFKLNWQYCISPADIKI